MKKHNLIFLMKPEVIARRERPLIRLEDSDLADVLTTDQFKSNGYSLIDGLVPKDGMILVKSPYDGNLFAPIERASEGFAIRQRDAFIAFLIAELGAKDVEVTQRTKKRIVSIEMVKGRGKVKSPSVKVTANAKETKSSQKGEDQFLNKRVSAKGVTQESIKALADKIRDKSIDTGLYVHSDVRGLIDMRLGPNPIREYQVKYTVNSFLKEEVVAVLKLSSSGLLDADFGLNLEKQVNELSEFELEVKISFPEE